MTGRQWRYPALVMFSVGYGANQFVPLLVHYRHSLALSDAAATAIFGVYALGLIPSLLVAGRLSDRYGRRPVVLLAAALSLVASAVLVTGRWGPAGLYVGRLLTGVVSGTAFSAGTAWVKELSAGDPPGAGARRAALALTAGFGIGPLVAGPLAQWAPGPDVLSYLVHLVLAAAALVLVLPVPETFPGRPAQAPVVPRSVRTRRFRHVIAPIGPWVFGSVTLVFTTLPAHGTPRLDRVGIAFPGVLAAVGLAAGLAVQPAARRLHAAVPAGRAAALSLAVVALGCLAAALATAEKAIPTLLLATVVLGAGYGCCIIVGLREVEALAPPDELGALGAVFYSLAYSGLVIPYVLALVAPSTGYPAALVATAAVAAACAAFSLSRRTEPAPPPVWRGSRPGATDSDQDVGL